SGPPDFRYCEDLVLDSEPGVAYLSCDPGRALDNMVMDVHRRPVGQLAEGGGVWRLEYNKQAFITKVWDGSGIDDFHPLGMTKNATHLHVINLAHAMPASIEIFDIEKNHHVETIRDPVIRSPNSLHLFGNDGSFFFTNDHHFITGIPKLAENFGRLPLGTIGFYNSTTRSAYVVAKGFLFPNGLDGTDDVLYVSETFGPTVTAFRIEMGSKEHPILVREHKTDLFMAPDNLHYDHDSGNVIIAGHPRGLALIQFAKHVESAAMSPSKVVIWNTKTDDIKTLFEDDGSVYGSSASGAIDVASGKLLVSGLYETGIMICES
ncbi:hypothetical protein BX666DRAFT_1861582, partial [Dichotomocladium elegans]